MYGIIYKATGPTGLVYIGQTTKSLKMRKGQHVYRMKKGDKRSAFQIALLTDGLSAFIWDQIDTAETREELDTKEKHWIAHYQSDNPAHGYNSNDGGSSFTTPVEMRQKISEARKGIKFSLEHRRKISEAHKGKRLKPESIQKRTETRKANGGYCVTTESRQKISAAKKGHTTSEATRQKISATLKSKGILPPWIKNR